MGRLQGAGILLERTIEMDRNFQFGGVMRYVGELDSFASKTGFSNWNPFMPRSRDHTGDVRRVVDEASVALHVFLQSAKAGEYTFLVGVGCCGNQRFACIVELAEYMLKGFGLDSEPLGFVIPWHFHLGTWKMKP